MTDKQEFSAEVSEAIWAKTLGEEMLKYLKSHDPDVAKRATHAATEVLGQIKEILDDASVDDAECFQRIEKIVDAFHEAGIHTSRHDW